MSKRAKGRPTGPGKQKQPTLFQSISKTRGKAEDAGVEGASTTVVVVSDDEDSVADPYAFLNTQSHEVEPLSTPQKGQLCPGGTSSNSPTKTKANKTPKISKKSSPRARKSPAIMLEEQQRKEEQDMLEKVLEESRRCAEREERNRRLQKRAEEKELDESLRMLSQIQSKANDVIETLERQSTPEDQPAITPELENEHIHAEEAAPGLQPDSDTDSTPLLNRTRNTDPPVLKSVSVKRLKLKSGSKTTIPAGRPASPQAIPAGSPTSPLAISAGSPTSPLAISAGSPTSPLAIPAGSPTSPLAIPAGSPTSPLAISAGSPTSPLAIPAGSPTSPLAIPAGRPTSPLAIPVGRQEVIVTLDEVSNQDLEKPMSDILAPSIDEEKKRHHRASDSDSSDVTCLGDETPPLSLGENVCEDEPGREEEKKLHDPPIHDPVLESTVPHDVKEISSINEHPEAMSKKPVVQTQPVTSASTARGGALRLKRPRKQATTSRHPVAKRPKLDEPAEAMQNPVHVQQEDPDDKIKPRIGLVEVTKESIAKPKEFPQCETHQTDIRPSPQKKPAQSPLQVSSSDESMIVEVTPQQLSEAPCKNDNQSLVDDSTVISAAKSLKLHTSKHQHHKTSEQEKQCADPGTISITRPKMSHHRAQTSSATRTVNNRKVAKPPPTPPARKNPPPQLFAPPGVPPAEYTPIILKRFDDFFAQLSRAQSKEICRVPWGEPVVTHSKQRSNTLDFQAKKRSRAKPSTPGHIIQHKFMVTLPSNSKTSSSQDIAATSAGDPKEKTGEATPSRDRITTRRKVLDKSGGEKVSDMAKKLGVYYDLTDSGKDSEAMDARAEELLPLASGTTSMPSPHHSLDPSQEDNLLLITHPDSPPYEQQTPSPSSDDGAIIGGNSSPLVKQGKIASASSTDTETRDATIAATTSSRQGGWLTRRGSTLTRSGRGSIQRKRPRRARIMDDSDSESDDIAPKSTKAWKGSDTKGLARRSLVSDVLGSTSLKKTWEVELQSDDELPSSPKQKRVSFGRGLRQKKGPSMGAKSTRNKESVIDLTEDTQAGHHLDSLESGTADEGEEEVVCPICSNVFPPTEVEEHASECQRNPDSPSAHSEIQTGGAAVLRPRHLRSKLPTTAELGDKDLETDESCGEEEGAESEEYCDEIDPSTGPGTSSGRGGVIPCEGGGFMVDPSTISNSPIKSFTRIKDLPPHEQAGYYNQFKHTKSRRSRGRVDSSSVNTWGRPDFDELLVTSGGKRGRGRSSYQHARGMKGDWRARRGRGRGRGRGRRGKGQRSWKRGFVK